MQYFLKSTFINKRKVLYYKMGIPKLKTYRIPVCRQSKIYYGTSHSLESMG